MTQGQKLTKREKILLFSLGVVAVVFLAVQFIIMPLANRYNTGIEEREHLRSEKALHEIEVASLPSLRQQNIDSRERFEKLTSGYPENVPNEIIDNRWLTPLCNFNQLSIISLRFAQRDELPPPPPPTQPDRVSYQDPDAPEEEVYVPEPRPVFIKVTAFMNATGTYQNLLHLIDDVSNTEYLRLTNVGFTDDLQGNLSELGSTISLTFEVTMLNTD